MYWMISITMNVSFIPSFSKILQLPLIPFDKKKKKICNNDLLLDPFATIE